MLVSLLVFAGLTSAAPNDLESITAAHGAALLALSDECVERQLFNDAQRLLLTAPDWDADDEVLSARTAALRAVRVQKIQEERDEYDAYLASKDCVRARAWLEQAEQDLCEATTDDLCLLARELLREGDSPVAEAAIALAFTLAPDSRDLRRVAGKKRLDELRRQRREEHGLANLSLGETIVGPQVTVDDFEGKVVVWRSASL